MVKSASYAWIAPLLVGAAAATAGEVSMSLLLYSGPGLARSLTVILTVQAAALGAGVWSAPTIARPDLLEAVRRRWLLSLGAYVLATVYSVFWSVAEPVVGRPMGQGFGLGLMAALPLFACGSVLGGMTNVAARDAAAGVRPVGGPAFAGAVLAFAVTGMVLPRALAPFSLFLGCVILLSAGGLMWGGSFDRRRRVRRLADRPSVWGALRVEDRILPAEESAVRVMLEGEHTRRWIDARPTSFVPWEIALLRSWAASAERTGTVLMVGGGASALAREAAIEYPGLVVEVFERNPAVAELTRDHLGGEPGRDPARLHTGNLDDVVEGLEPGRYDLVVVDSMAFGPVGGLDSISRATHSRLFGLLSADGVLAVGPEPRQRPLPTGWKTLRLSRHPQAPAEGLGVRWPGVEHIDLAVNSGEASWPATVEGFVVDDASGAPGAEALAVT